MLTRHDLLAAAQRTDERIRAVLGRRHRIRADVHDGVVTLTGSAGTHDEVDAVVAQAAAVPGVVEVDDRVLCLGEDRPRHPVLTHLRRWFR